MTKPTLFLLALLMLSACGKRGAEEEPNRTRVIRELNQDEIPKGDKVIALVGARLIDGRGGDPVENACVIVINDKIQRVGESGKVQVPATAEIVDAAGLTMLPGLIDAHYHNEDSDSLAVVFLRNGVTSVRDPGEWIESYHHLRQSGKPIPRLFLAGPHLDTYPPAYPADSYIVKDPTEAAAAVDRFVRQGATVIKAYYGLSIEMIEAICTASHAFGVPVTAHLEITDARDAINAGLDGIEHVTSFGICLMPPQEGERYKQKVMADNNARRRGRYEVWASMDLDTNPAADSLVRFLKEKGTFVSPTLAVFERRPDRGDSTETSGFANMLRFVGKASRGGVRFVVGSHSYVPYADFGFAYHRELELLQEAGMTSMEVITAATLSNARFFRVDERLGSIEEGKLADIVFVEGDPLRDIRDMRKVARVMLNGTWVPQ